MPALSPDRRTYTFTIRPGYRFSPPSGEPVTAESFRRGIEHALSPVLGDRAPALADLLGARAYHDGRALHISGIRVRGATLKLTLTRPSPGFLRRLSLPYFAPLPAGVPNLAGGASDHPPPSAGPYYAAEAINGEYLLLKRNPNYRGPRPHALDTIVLREGVDAARAVEHVRDGSADAVTLADPLLPLTENPAILPETRFFAFNAHRGAFTSARTRRAAAYALSHSALAAGLIHSSGVLPPGIATTTKVGVAPPPQIRPTTAVMAVSPECAACRHEFELARTALAGVGITLRPHTADLAAVRRHPDAVDLLLTSVTLEYPDPATFLTRMLTVASLRAWLPLTTRAALRRLPRREGAARDSAAADLAVALVKRDAPVAALGHPALGQRFSARLSCRISPRFGVDLAALCLA